MTCIACKYFFSPLDDFMQRMHSTGMEKKKKQVRHLQVRLTPRAYQAVDRARGVLTRQKWAVGVLEKAAGL